MSELRKHRKSRKSLKFAAGLGLFFVFAAAVFYGLVFSPFFRIDNIFIQGAAKEYGGQIKQIAEQKLSAKIFWRIPVANQIFLPDKEIAEEVLDRFPEIKTVDIKTSLAAHSLTMDLEVRQPAVIWCRVLPPDNLFTVSSSTDEALQSFETRSLPDVEKCFFADNEGFIFRPAPVLSGGAVPIVYEQLSRSIRDAALGRTHDLSIKDVVFNSKALNFILEAKKQLNAANLSLTDFIVSAQTLGDLEILAPDGWKIILSLDKSPTAQINALRRVLEEEIKDKRSQLEYVDLRVENRVYYKLRQ